MARSMISDGKAGVARLARQHADYERAGHGIHFGGASHTQSSISTFRVPHQRRLGIYIARAHE
jgi:hypothetical protein